jgi:hypothetical protein
MEMIMLISRFIRVFLFLVGSFVLLLNKLLVSLLKEGLKSLLHSLYLLLPLLFELLVNGSHILGHLLLLQLLESPQRL